MRRERQTHTTGQYEERDRHTLQVSMRRERHYRSERGETDTTGQYEDKGLLGNIRTNDKDYRNGVPIHLQSWLRGTLTLGNPGWSHTPFPKSPTDTHNGTHMTQT
jgi:hypothetical protein